MRKINVRFSLGSATAFTKEPPNPFLAVECNNITLEWTYNFGSGSFRQLLFGNADTPTMVDKLAGEKVPWIAPAYKGRLLVNVTDTYTLITFLKVNRNDSTTHSLTVSNSNRERAKSYVDITVECKYEKENKNIYNNIFLLFQFAFAIL